MCVLVPVGPPRGTERCSGAVGLLNPAAGLMPLILGAAALLENVLAAGDVCTAGGFLSTASLEHKNNLLHKSKQRFRFFFSPPPKKKTRVCSEGHVSLMFQTKLQTFTCSWWECREHVETITTNGSLFMEGYAALPAASLLFQCSKCRNHSGWGCKIF